MPMNYTTLTDFSAALKTLIGGAEGSNPFPEEVVNDGTVTLGNGYTFIRKVQGRWGIYEYLEQDLAILGITLTQTDIDRLGKIRDSLNAGQNGTAAHSQLISNFTRSWCYNALTPDQIQTLYKTEIGHQTQALEGRFKKFRPADGAVVFAGLANTRELVAITSLFYNSVYYVNKDLVNALAEGNRAEAWYQIRYGCWKESGDALKNSIWAGRRYLESTIFALYEAASTDSLAEAKDIYRMFTRHRDHIMQREATYQSQVGFVNGYGPYQQALAAAGAGPVQTMKDSLYLACTAILTDLADNGSSDTINALTKWKEQNHDITTFNPLDLYVDPNTSDAACSFLDVSKDYKGSINKNDSILIGGDNHENTLTGGDGSDLIIGGNKNDYIKGGKGDDVLAGGGGDDTYVINSGDGNDTIEDKQGTNTIIFNGRTLRKFFRFFGTNVYESEDGKISGAMIGTDFIVTDTKTNQTITLNADFQEGDFGITFKDKPAELQTVTTINGDIKPVDIEPDDPSRPETLGVQAAPDAYGNPLGDPQPFEDILHGTAGNDHIMSGELSDDVAGRAGDDWIEGGTGSDWLSGEAGNDIVEGGDGSDVVKGDEGDDWLFGGAKTNTDLAQALADAIESGDNAFGAGQKGDWLSDWGGGKDTLIGGNGNDVLAGGEDQDLLVAGAGNDLIFGDANYIPYPYMPLDANGNIDPDAWIFQIGHGNWYHGTSQTHDWAVSPDSLGEVLGEHNPPGGGADTIYAGNGDDYVWAGEGGDIVYGGDGADNLDGENGDDIVFGGAGDDTLYGDGTLVNSGNDYLDGGDGNDTLWGGNADDILIGDAGDDQLYGEEGSNTLDGGDGNDTLNTGGTANTLDGGAGDDTLEAVGGGNYLDGGDGADTLTATEGNNTLYGGAGDDDLQASGGNNYLDDTEGSNTLLATDGGNTLIAGDGNDTLQGSGGGNYLDAGEGANTLIADGGGNTLIAGSGDDTLSAGGGNNYLESGDGNNTLIADGGGNTLIAGMGVDTLSSMGGGSYLDGGDGNDLLIADTGNNNLYGGAGDDTLSSAGGSSTLDGGDGNDHLIADMGNNTLYGGAGNDILSATGGLNYLYGGAGADTYRYDVGFGESHLIDTFDEFGTANGGIPTYNNYVDFNRDFVATELVVGLGSLMLSFSNGDVLHIEGYDPNNPEGSCSINSFRFNNCTLTLQDILNLGGPAVNYTIGPDIVGTEGADILPGTDKAEHIYGLGGDDVIEAGARNDYIEGGDGNDYIDGGAGADRMLGGAGDDTYVVDNGNDMVEEESGGGIDTVISSISYGLGIQLENLTLTGAANLNGAGNQLDNILTGNSGDNMLTGWEGNDTLDGGAGADTLSGGLGNDIVDGGAGADTMTGGYGDDTYVVDDARDQVIESEAGQTHTSWTGYRYVVQDIDTVRSSISYTLGANLENLTLTGSADINGTGNAQDNIITGNSGRNVLTGSAGNDKLDGGAGADVMDGGAGHDSYVVDNAGDVIVESAAGAAQWWNGRYYAGEADQVYASVSHTLGNNLEDLTLTGADDIDGTGNGLANYIVGNSGNNVLSGGAGDDIYIVQNAGDTVIEGAGGGTDRVYAYADFALSGNTEYLYLQGEAIAGTGDDSNNTIVGNDLGNVIAGGAGSDKLDGMTGDDAILGGDGDDTIYGGYDDYVYDPVSDQMVLNSNSDLLDGGAGNDNIDGGSGADSILGGTGNDVLFGGDDDGGEGGSPLLNNDIIDGGDGDDSINGGSGDDRLFGGAGDDYIYGGVDRGVRPYFDSATQSVVYAGSNDYLDGGAGLDTLVGRGGDDIYIVDGSYSKISETVLNDCGDPVAMDWLDWTTDDVIEYYGEGYDIVYSSAGYALADNIEELRLVFDATLELSDPQAYADLLSVGQYGYGNDLDNVIIGNQLNNWLDGGWGADIMEGGAGDDTYVIDLAGDVIVEGAGNGVDSVVTLIDYTLGDNLENLTLWDGATLGMGNAADNVINGNAAYNELFGGDGNDKLVSNGGSDHLFGGAGDDRYVFRLGDGSVTVTDELGADTLFIGNDLTAADIDASRIVDDLILSVRGTADSVRIVNWFVQTEGVNAIAFCDSPGWARADIEAMFNAPPAANADSLTVTEDVPLNTIAVADLLANDTDPNTGDSLSLVGFDAVTAQGNSVVQDGNGDLVLDIGDKYQSLGAGQNIIDSFSYTVADPAGETSTANVDITIAGLNDLPVTAADDSTALQEDVIVTATGNVLANDSDIDQGTILQVANAGVFAGQYGTLTLNADGSYNYALDNTSLNVQSLAAGQVATEIFGYQATDGIASTPSTLKVTITGTNDAPAVTVDTVALQEDFIIAASGNVLDNDSDIDQGALLQVANAGVFAGLYGQLTLNADGSYTYVLDNASMSIQSLAEGQVITETFAYLASDGLLTTPSMLSVTITGANDGPVVVADTAVVQEDYSVSATGNVLANDSDPDMGTVLQVANAGVFAGQYGSLTLNTDGSYEYLLDNASPAVQSLAAGQTLSETFAYQVTDGLASTASSLTVSILGSNDAPVVLADSATVREDLDITAIGNVLANDSDIDQGTILSVADAGTRQGLYGSLTLNTDGSYAYSLDPSTGSGQASSQAVQSLGRNAQVTEHFGYLATDGIASVAGGLDILIQGNNDAPVLANALADQNATGGQTFTWQVPGNSFSDVDTGDTLNYTATQADGTALPSWLVFDPATRSFSGTAPQTAGFVDVMVTAKDVAANGSTQGSLAASDVFRITVAQGNTGGGNGGCDDGHQGHHGNHGGHGGGSGSHHEHDHHSDRDHDHERDDDRKHCKDDTHADKKKDDHIDDIIHSWFERGSKADHHELCDGLGFGDDRIAHEANRNVSRNINDDFSKQWAQMNARLKEHLAQNGNDDHFDTAGASHAMPVMLNPGKGMPQLGKSEGVQMKAFAGLNEGLERLGC